MKLYIYGIYRLRRCIYVGMTIDPATRLRTHRNPTRGKLRGIKRTKMKIFRTVTLENGPRIEVQIIKAFKRKGQAEFNLSVKEQRAFPQQVVSVVQRSRARGWVRKRNHFQ